MKHVVRPGAFICMIVHDVTQDSYVGRVVHQGGLLQVASGSTADEVENLLPDALASQYFAGTLEPYPENIIVVTLDILPPSLFEPLGPFADRAPATGQQRLNARDMDLNLRGPIATYETEVIVVEVLEELELWYVKDEQGNRFGVDRMSEVHVELAIGTRARALVTEEGYALKLFPLSNN